MKLNFVIPAVAAAEGSGVFGARIGMTESTGQAASFPPGATAAIAWAWPVAGRVPNARTTRARRERRDVTRFGIGVGVLFL
jgi:hypothetical protein